MRNFRLDDESGHQEALFSWAAYRTGLMPELQYMYHVPNGGKRDKATAAVLKRQGVKAGVPDIMLDGVVYCLICVAKLALIITAPVWALPYTIWRKGRKQ